MHLFQNRTILLVFSLSLLFSAQAQKKKEVVGQAKMEYYRNFYEGNKQKMLGNFSEAALFFTRCTQIDPGSSAAFYELARSFNNQGNYMGALVHAKNAVEIDNSNKWYLLLLATLYEQNNLPDEAIKVYKNLTKLFPEDPDYHLQLGIMLTRQGKTKEAINSYNNAEAIVGVNEQISLEKERVYLISGNKQKAIEEIIKLKNAFPFEYRYHGILAESYLDNNQPDKAFQIYQGILEKDPENGLANLSLAEFYNNAGKPDLSFQHLKKAFGSYDVDTDLKIKMLARFVPYADKSSQVKEQAREMLDILLEKHPDDIKVHTLEADFLSITGNYEAARDKYELVVKTEKDKYIIWEQLLLIENELKAYEKMLPEAAEALEYFPNLPQFYLFYGLAAVKTGDNKKAIEKLTEGMDFLVDNKNMEIQFLSFLAEAYSNNGETSEADITYQKALGLMPNDDILLFDYAKFLLKNNLQFAKAKEIIEKAIKFAPEENAEIFEVYGDILFKLNDKTAAIAQWQKAKDLGINTKELINKIEEANKPE